MIEVKLYPPQKPWELEPHYSRHVSAMTTEELHSKADIAEQLAWRDKELEALRALRDALPRCEAPLCEEQATCHGDHFYCGQHSQAHSVDLPYADALRALTAKGGEV